MKTVVLVVEDERDLNRMICDYLVARGFEALAAFDGPSAVRLAFERRPALALLDLNLPGLDGLDVARTLSSQLKLPIIATTARGELEERLEGFAAGVDDYVVKPFSLPELVARLRAVLRRAADTETTERPALQVGELVIDRERRQVSVAGRFVPVTTAQFAILERLASHPGRVYSRLELLESYGDNAYEGYERTIDVHIKNIRKRIESDSRRPRRIITVRGVGYRLEAESPGGASR